MNLTELMRIAAQVPWLDPRTLVESGPVRAAVDAAGTLIVTGTARSVHAEHTSETSLSNWHTTLEDKDRLVGGFTGNRKFQNFWGEQRVQEVCTIRRLERQNR